MKEKRGMTAIVTVVILIALVLVAIAIVWAVVSGIIRGATSQAEYNNLCLSVDLSVTNATATNAATGLWDISVKRNTGGSEFDGIAFILSNSGDSSDPVYEPVSNLGVLEIRKFPITVTELEGSATKVQAVAYFVDDEGEKHLCSQTVAERTLA